MATFVLIHGAGDVGWYWHLVERELNQRGHEVVAPDLPCDDDSAGLPEYVDTVVDAIGDRRKPCRRGSCSAPEDRFFSPRLHAPRRR